MQCKYNNNIKGTDLNSRKLEFRKLILNFNFYSLDPRCNGMFMLHECKVNFFIVLQKNKFIIYRLKTGQVDLQ